MILNYNGYHLEPISAYEARKLPDGSVLTYMRYWVDEHYKTTKREFYRVTIETREIVGGTDQATRWTPDADFPTMPCWEWTWLSESFGHSYLRIMTEEEYFERMMKGEKVINAD